MNALDGGTCATLGRAVFCCALGPSNNTPRFYYPNGAMNCMSPFMSAIVFLPLSLKERTKFAENLRASPFNEDL